MSGNTVERCEVCGWPLADSREVGCVKDDCSYRPQEGSPEFYRILERRKQLEAGKKLIERFCNV